MQRHRHASKQHSTTALVEPLETRRLLSAAAHTAIADIERGPGGPPVPPPGSIALPNTAGQLDPSFGSGGTTTVNFNGLSVQARAVATEPDGKMVEVGAAYTGPNSSEFAIVRFNFDGTLDTTFGPNHNGIVLTTIHSATSLSGAEAVAIDSEGRIVVAGSDDIDAVGSSGGNGVSSDMYVARYLPNGTLDPSFGSHGISDINFGNGNTSDVGGMALQRDGKIVVVGIDVTDFLFLGSGVESGQFAIARLNSNGSLDESFNYNPDPTSFTSSGICDGLELVPFNVGNAFAMAHAVTIDYSGTPASNPHYGSIVVSGIVNLNFNAQRMAAIRLTPSGSLDSSFNGNGQYELIVSGFTNGDSTGVVVQSDGDIVLSGTLGTYNRNDGTSKPQIALLRLLPNGVADKTFGSAGLVHLAYNGVDDDHGDSLVLGPNNRLIVGGNIGNLTTITAFTSNGQLDPTFGTGGWVTTSFPGPAAAAGIAYLGDRIVVGGGGQFDTARYIDTNPNVAVGTFNYNASPQSPVILIVGRGVSLPYDTVVDFSIGGTAVLNTDYTVSGLVVPKIGILGQPFPSPFVDIPAGQSYVLVTLTPVAQSTPQPTTTATFNIIPNTFYNVGTPSSVTINILGNEATPTTIGASADAYVQDGADANTNFGSSQSLVVKSGSAGFNRYTYLTFNLSNVSPIDSAELQLYGNLSSTQDASVVTDVYSVANTSWTQSGITFNNAPAAGPTPLASTTIAGTTPQTYTWNVTAYLQAQKAAGNNIVSFVLEDPQSSDSAVIFNSSQVAMGPSLVIN